MDEQSLVKKSWRRRWAISTLFISLLAALWAVDRQPPRDPAASFFWSLVYSPFIFFLIFFGNLWAERLFFHLGRFGNHRWTWWLRYGILLGTFWWFGAQLNHYLYYIGWIDAHIELQYEDIYSHLDAAAWKTYASLGLSVLVGILALFAKRFFFPRWTQRQNEIAFVLLLVLVMAIGWVTNDLFRNGIF